MPQIPELQPLEPRQLFATALTAPWGLWPVATNLSKVVEKYPWLDGGNFNVAVIDKGIDYLHPALGGTRKTNTASPRVFNVYDYQDNDYDPYPSTSELVDPTSPHATGVAGILAGVPYLAPDGKRYQGVLQNSKLFNLRTKASDSQNTIKKALGWVAANAARYHITAINLTDFVGTPSATPVYANEIQALYNAGVFVATPCANDWINPKAFHAPIGYPAKSPYIYGVGGINRNNTLTPYTQRGAGLDIVSAAEKVSLPYYVPSTKSDIWVDYGQGNSWAAPYVTGAAVLVQQIDPTIKPNEIMSILQDSGAFTPDPDAASTGIKGYKRLDILRAADLAYWRRDDDSDRATGSNDDPAHATKISLNSAGQGTIANQKLLLHDHDYYAIDITTAGQYNLSVGYKGPSRYPTAEVTNAAGTVIATVGANTTTTLTPGRYYLDLYHPTQSLIGPYSLTISRPTTTTPTTTTRPAATPTFSTQQIRRANESLFA